MRRAVVVVSLTLAIAACRPDMAAWRQRLDQPPAAGLAGAWTIEMRADSGEYRHEAAPARAIGAIALVLNRERVTTSLFGEPPVAFGTYDIGLDTLGLATGETASTPDLWLDARGDSLVLTLSPRAKWPVTLAGVRRGDSVAGRWHADRRAGPGGMGVFVLHRP